MRSLQVVVAIVGGVPILSASFVLPGCNADPTLGIGVLDAAAPDASRPADASVPPADQSIVGDLAMPPPPPDFDTGGRCSGHLQTHTVRLPPPGVLPDPALLCAAQPPPVASNTAARVTLDKFDYATRSAQGFLAVPPALDGVISTPSLSVTSATDASYATMQVTPLVRVPGGYSFTASWPMLNYDIEGGSMTVKAAFTLACGGGAQQLVESITPVDLCYDNQLFSWESAGEACSVCPIIAEMAPSPIVSDGAPDDLPLSRVILIRVRELARAGRSVLMMAEHDGGAEAHCQWRTSEGELEILAPDVVLWRLPEGISRPFGQVAVQAEHGAAVENFLWGAA